MPSILEENGLKNDPTDAQGGAHLGSLLGPVGATAGYFGGNSLGTPNGKYWGMGSISSNLSNARQKAFGKNPFNIPDWGKPQTANIPNVVTPQTTQDAIDAQNRLLQALQGQQGLAAQSAALQQMQGLSNQFGAGPGQYNGAGNLQNSYDQMQNVANGTGPNPAQAMLNQATGQNVANQAALMAGQRGAGSNVGLMARQAAGQGAGIQQNAAGQGATMQANQSLNAMNQMAGIAGQQLAAQQAANAAQAGMSNQIAGQQIGTTGQQQAEMLGGLYGQAGLGVQQQGGINATNAQLAQAQADTNKQVAGGGLSGLAQGIGAMFAAEGGEVPHMADGGMPQPMAQTPKSRLGMFLNSNYGRQVEIPGSAPGQKPGMALQTGMSDMGKAMGQAYKNYNAMPSQQPSSPAVDSTNLGSIPQTAAKGGQIANTGGNVSAKKPSQKAEKSGDSYSNDKIPAMLSEGEVVIPRSVMQSKDPVKGSAEFVLKLLREKGKK